MTRWLAQAGTRNAASAELLAHPAAGDVYPLVRTRRKIESTQQAQTTGDVEDSLVMTGQASAINDLVDVAEFVPAMADEAAAILRSLAASVADPVNESATGCV